jgi:murein DD-endopeptidase MepM/ murein hydrolase activator NlpD
MTACLILSSCLTPTGKQKPAEVVQYGVKGGAGSTGMHTVLKGDTVYTVSKRYNLPLRDIIAVNDLSAPYKLPPGYRLKLPPPNEYRAKPGDTLNGISRLFNASLSETARLNNLSPPYVIKKGQVIRLPSSQPKLEESFASNAPKASPEVMQAVKVASVEAEALAPPGGSGSVSATPAAVNPSAGFPPQPAPVTGSPNVQPVAVSPSIAPPVPPRSGSGRFMRPVDGRVISAYGPKPDGLHNDGINIKAPRGTAVRAAENGVVAYTGNGMEGYGNLVLIRHADRWMTAYAHMDKVLVKKGQAVKAGQSIGTVGSTGGVDSPQLHFEVRKGTKAVDPEGVL